MFGAAQNCIRLHLCPKTFTVLRWTEQIQCDLNVRVTFWYQGKTSGFSFPPVIQPRTHWAVPRRQGRTGQHLLALFSFHLITCSWLHRDRMRNSGKGILEMQKEKQKICCKLKLICGKTTNTAQIWRFPFCCCGPWANSVPLGSYADRKCQPDLFFQKQQSI